WVCLHALLGRLSSLLLSGMSMADDASAMGLIWPRRHPARRPPPAPSPAGKLAFVGGASVGGRSCWMAPWLAQPQAAGRRAWRLRQQPGGRRAPTSGGPTPFHTAAPLR